MQDGAHKVRKWTGESHIIRWPPAGVNDRRMGVEAHRIDFFGQDSYNGNREFVHKRAGCEDP